MGKSKEEKEELKVMGTYPYLPAEIRSKEVDEPTNIVDTFSLAMICYEMLFGHFLEWN